LADVQSFPLSICKLAPENARHASKGAVGGLAASIEAEGLIDPLHAYRAGKTVMVWDGGRRLRALKALARSKRLPAALQGGIPVLISDRRTARMRSLVSFVRDDLHPAEEFRAYKALFDAGQDPGQIAASMGVDARRVAQLLKLCSLAPEIIDAFEAGVFGLDTAQAFTLTDDHDKQREVLAACGDWINAGRVRQLLRTGTVSPRDRLARFVGREAYTAASGAVLVDLFTTGEDAEVWTDSSLVERLAAEKLDAAVAELKAEGWAWVTVVDPFDYNWNAGFERLRVEPVPLTEAEQATYDTAAAVLEDEDTDPEAYDAAEATIARLEAVMEGGEIRSEQRATAGVFIQVDGNGQLTVRRGYLKASRARPQTTAKAAVADDPGLHGWGHTGHWHMTHIATAAVRHALLKDPAAAYDVLVAGLAWGLVGGRFVPVMKLEPKGIDRTSIPAEARLAGEDAWQARCWAWQERLPTTDYKACFDYVAGLKQAEKAEIVALGVGLALDAVEPRFDQRRPGAWTQLGVIGRRAGVDITQAWTPDTAFLSKGSKAALLAALAETGGAEPFAKAKKSELVATLANRVGPNSWIPKLLRGLRASAPGVLPIAAE
jgi:ParB family chromosome partitioning protein